MKANIDEIMNVNGKKLVKIWGQSINSYIIIDSYVKFEAYTTQCEALLEFNKRAGGGKKRE